MDIKSAFLGSNGNVKLVALSDIGNLASFIVKSSLFLAMLILFFYLILGGISMISGAGKNDPQKLEAGKKAATSALIGFIVVFSAYWIVKLVGQIIGMGIL